MKPEPQGGGTVQFEIKNATEAEVRTIDGSGFTIKPLAAGEKFTTLVRGVPGAVEGRLSLCDIDARVNLWGANVRDGRIELIHDMPWPINLLSLSVTYQIEPANGEGKNAR